MLTKLFSPRYYATIVLILTSVYILMIEPGGISPLKVGMMGLSTLFLFTIYSSIHSKALLFGSFYLVCVLATSYSHESVRFSTIGYLGLFVLNYALFYNLLHYYRAFSLEYFIKLVKIIIYVFCITLVLQQICLLVGIRNFPIINLVGQRFLSVSKLPIWTLEPSHSARIVGCLFLAYIKCASILNEKKMSLKNMFGRGHRWVLFSTLWMLLTMGSGTGIIVLMALSLYFVQARSFVYVIPLFFLLILTLPYLHIEQLDRALGVIKATLTGNKSIIIQEDDSAAVRVLPLVNTLFDTNLLDWKTWIGVGTIDSYENLGAGKMLSIAYSAKLGCIVQYGLISFIASLLFVYTCAIRRFFSLENLFFIFIQSCGLMNISYGWSCVMLFTCISYFESSSVTDKGTEVKYNFFLVYMNDKLKYCIK